MRLIHELKYVKKKGRAEVEVAFSDASRVNIDADLAVQFRLHKGMEISDEFLLEITTAQENLAARRRLIHWLAMRKKSTRQAEQYLRELRFSESAVNLAIAAAKELGYLNDETFADAYVQSQARIARKGPRALRQELQSHGLDKELISSAIEPFADTEYQREKALELGRKKLPSLKSEEPRKRFQKLYSFLVRKGYDGNICSEVTRQLTGESPEPDDFLPEE